jgi:hypothetical protein
MDLKPKLLFKTAPSCPEDYIGRNVVIDGVIHKIETIKPRFQNPKYFNINGNNPISLLRFFAQMNGDRSITEDQFLKFEAMDVDAVKNEDTKFVPGMMKS